MRLWILACYLVVIMAMEALGNGKDRKCEYISSFLAPISQGPLGLRVKRNGEEEFVVIRVEQNSPSVDILHANDIIFALGGQSTKGMTLNQFSARLNLLRSTGEGEVNVAYYTDWCVEEKAVAPAEKIEEKVAAPEEDEDYEEEEVLGHFRVQLDNFRLPLGLRVAQQRNKLVVLNKVSSLEQWKQVEPGDFLEQIHGEEVASSSKLKSLLQRFEGRKMLGMRFSRRMPISGAAKKEEEGMRIAFSVIVQCAGLIDSLRLAQLKSTDTVVDGHVVVLESKLDYVFIGDRLKEVDENPVKDLAEAMEAIDCTNGVVELSFVRNIPGTMDEINAQLMAINSMKKEEKGNEQIEDGTIDNTNDTKEEECEAPVSNETIETEPLKQDEEFKEAEAHQLHEEDEDGELKRQRNEELQRQREVEEELQSQREKEKLQREEEELQRQREEEELQREEEEELQRQREEKEELQKQRDEEEEELQRQREDEEGLQRKKINIEKEQQHQEEKRKHLEEIKSTRARLEQEWAALEAAEELAGLPHQSRPVSCDEEAIASALGNPKLIQLIAKALAQQLQE